VKRGAIGILALLVIWEVLGRTVFAGSRAVPPPTAILTQLRTDGLAFYWPNIRTTLREAGEGWLWGNVFSHFLSGTVGIFRPSLQASEFMLSTLSLAFSMTGLLIAYLLYLRYPGLPTFIAWRIKALYQLLLDKYYIDQIYDAVVSRPLFLIAQYVLFRGVDYYMIDGLVNGTGTTVEAGGDAVRRVETGNVQHYALVYLIGAVGIAAFYLYMVLR